MNAMNPDPTESLAKRRRFWIATILYCAIPAAILFLVARDLATRVIPDGHDSLVHMENALALKYLVTHLPGQALSFFRTLEFHWPPLTYLVTLVHFLFFSEQWPFHATTFMFAAAFMVLYSLTLRKVVSSWFPTLVGLVVVCADPYWITVSIAYNLELGQLVCVTLVFWVLFSRAYEKGPLHGGALGLLCGLAMLSKAMTPVHVVLPVMLVVGPGLVRTRHNRQAFWGSLAFAVTMTVVAVAWYLPILHHLPGTFIASRQLHIQDVQTPWYKSLIVESAGLPIVILFLLTLPFVRWKEVPAQAYLPLAGAGVSMLVLALVLNDWAWFALTTYALLVIFLVAALDKLRPSIRSAALTLLLCWYGALALLSWFQSTAPVADLLAAGAPRPIGLPAPVDLPQTERTIADQILKQVAGPHLETPVVLDLTGREWFRHVEKLVCMRQPSFALVRGLQSTPEAAIAVLPRARYLICLEKPGAVKLDFSALAVHPDLLSAPGKLAIIDSALDEQAQWFKEISRIAVKDVELAIYEHRRLPKKWPGKPEPIHYLEYYQLADPTRHDCFLKATQKMLYAGQVDRALDRYHRLLLQMWETDPDLPPGWELASMTQWDPSLYTQALEGMATAYRASGRPLPEARMLARLLTGHTHPRYLREKWLARLATLEKEGEVDGLFVPTALSVLTLMDHNDLGHAQVTFQVLRHYSRERQMDAASAMLDRQLDLLPINTHSSFLWALCTSTRRVFDPRLAALVYAKALAVPALPAPRQAQIRLWQAKDLATGDSPDPGILPSGPFQTESQAQAATQAWLSASVSMRHADRADQALTFLKGRSEQVDQCKRCRDELLLETARALIDLGRTDEAIDALDRIRSDRDLRRIAKALRQSLKQNR